MAAGSGTRGVNRSVKVSDLEKKKVRKLEMQNIESRSIKKKS